MTEKHNRERRVNRNAKRVWVPLGLLRIAESSQRKFSQAHADYLLANFNLKMLGLPVASARDGVFYVVDGQHRVDALKRHLGDGWEAFKVECECYEGLSESEEADLFDRLNTRKTVNAFDRFKVRVTAKRELESEVDAVVRGLGLCVSRDKIGGAVGAVGTLCRVLTRSDAETLSKALRTIRDAYGDVGFDASVIDGIGHMYQRYNGTIDESRAVNQLAHLRGGVGGLLGRAEVLRKQTGNSKSHCVAAAAVDVYNTGRGGRKLPSWWSA